MNSTKTAKTYVTVNIEPEAQQALRRMAAKLTGREERRITLSEAILIAEREVHEA